LYLAGDVFHEELSGVGALLRFSRHVVADSREELVGCLAGRACGGGGDVGLTHFEFDRCVVVAVVVVVIIVVVAAAAVCCGCACLAGTFCHDV
jgi:hypothetical protein